MGLLIVIPTEFESQKIITHNSPKFFNCGAGLVSSAVNVAKTLSQNCPEALLLLGICGAYDSAQLCVGDVVRVDSCVLADFGVQDFNGSFLPSSQLGLGRSQWSASDVQNFPVAFPKLASRLKSLRGVASASVQCACGTDALAHDRAKQTQTLIEEMEGASVLACAESFGVPAFHVRAVSNRAGLRDRSAWKIDEALLALQRFLNSDE